MIQNSLDSQKQIYNMSASQGATLASEWSYERHHVHSHVCDEIYVQYELFNDSIYYLDHHTKVALNH